MPTWLQNLVAPTGKAAAIGFVASIFPILVALGVRVPAGLPTAAVGGVSAFLLLVGVTWGATTLHRGDPPASKGPPKPPAAVVSAGLVWASVLVLFRFLAVGLLFAFGCALFQTPAGKVVECSAATAATALASFCPPPTTPFCVAVAETAYEEACQAAANAGANQDDAHKAGLIAAQGQIDKLQKRGVQLSGSGGSSP